MSGFRFRCRTRPATTIVPVASGANLQTAINTAAAAGDGRTLLLAASGVWSGNYTLKAHTGPTITIRGGGTLPAAGVRVTPAFVTSAADWPTLQSPSTSPVITTENGANYWKVEGIHILPNVDATATANGVLIGDNNEAVLANYPDNIWFNQCVLHGNATTGQIRGFGLHGTNITFTNNYVYDIKSNDNDAQALFVFGPGPYTIDNNYLNSSGENFLVGGANSGINAHPTGTFTNNELEKDVAWFPSKLWSVKNVFELKCADGWTIQHNTIHGHWPDSQDGYAVLFTPRNQGGLDNTTVVQNIDFSCNYIYDVSSCFNIIGDDDEHTSARTNNITIRNNLVVVSAAVWGGDGRIFKVGRSPTSITIDNNTFIGDGTSMMFVSDNTSFANATGFIFTDNLFRHNDYGIGGDGTTGSGTLTLNTYFSSYTCTGNVYGDDTFTAFPSGNTRLSDAAWRAIFTNFAGADYTLAGATYAGKGRNFGC